MKQIIKLLAIVAISLASVSAFSQPLTSAPTPSVTASKVISIFSDAYTSVPGSDFFPNWGQVTTYTPTVVGASDHVLKYSNMNYQGVQFGSTQNCATMKYLHLDVWTTDANAATFPIAIIWSGGEKTVTKTVATNGTWTSIDIPLTEFTGAVLTSVIQFKFQSNEWLTLGAAGSPSKYTTVYLDNLYFWTDAADDTTAPTSFSATAGAVTSDAVELLLNATDNSGSVTYTISYGAGPTVVSTGGISGTQKSYTITGLIPSTAYNFSVVCKDAAGNSASNNPIVVPVTTGDAMAASPTPTSLAADVLSIYSNAYTATATGLQYQVWWNASWSDVVLADAGNAKKIVSTNGGGGCGIQFDNLNVSTMAYIHIDVFPTTATSSILKYNVVPVGGGGTGWSFFPTLTANKWNSCDIPVSALGLPGTSVFQVGFGTFGGEGIFYIDNVYFTKNLPTGINKVDGNTSVNCYPNPVLNKLNVSAQSEISEVTVRNLLGQSVKLSTINSTSSSIDLSEVSAGNYYVSVKLANGQVSTQKFVKL